MSLFASIQNSANALQVAQTGLNVTGNNIANANTPGYIRQELVQATAFGYRSGDLILGYGVRAVGVVQKVDEFTNARLRETGSQLASAQAQTDIYNQIESAFGELNSSDLSSQLSNFSNSVQDLLNQPGNDSLRQLVMERGKTLTSQVRELSGQLGQLANGLNNEIRSVSQEINRLTERIAKINIRIVETEGGRTSGSDAVGLRDERQQMLQDLAKLADIRAVEQPNGSVSVYVGGEYLVSEGIQRSVKFSVDNSGEKPLPEIRLADTDSPLKVTSGRLAGLYAARDGAAGGISQQLDGFARTLIEQFNRIHTQGQGLVGFSQTTGSNAADDTGAPLDLAGLPTKIVNGSFEIQVLDSSTGQAKTSNIDIHLTGSPTDTTLEDVKNQLNGVSGLSATISSDGKLKISSTSSKITFAFQNDTAGALTALGINTFFSGSSAADIQVNPALLADPKLFASSLKGVGGGTDNAVKLAQAFDEPLEELGGQSIKQNYESMVVSVTQQINVQQGTTEGLQNFYKTLEAQSLATSGVNLDEEAVKLIFYQRAFQASSQVIKISNEMLDTLVNL
ncbi:MAG: flagellar hook-associated protein FlgK [Pirellulales bacterium]